MWERRFILIVVCLNANAIFAEEVVREFVVGAQAEAIGVISGATRFYDSWPKIFVTPGGEIVIKDSANNRVHVFDPFGVQVGALAPTSVDKALWFPAQVEITGREGIVTKHKKTLAVYDKGGALLQQRSPVEGSLVPAYGERVVVWHSRNDTYRVYDATLSDFFSQDATPEGVMSTVRAGAGDVRGTLWRTEVEGTCFLYHYGRAGFDEKVLAGGHLLLRDGRRVWVVSPENLVVASGRLPEDSTREPVEHVGGPAGDAPGELIVEYESVVMGRDGKVYAFRHTPDEIALVRWTIADLASVEDLLHPVTNEPPAVAAVPRRQVGVAEEFAEVLDAADPDGDDLFYELLEGPLGARVHPRNGVVYWTPFEDDVGSNPFVVQVDDHKCGRDRVEFVVEVTE